MLLKQLLFSIFYLLLFLSGSPALAAHSLSRPLYSSLQKVQDKLAAGQADEALRLLQGSDSQAHTDYAHAIVEQTYAYIWLQLDKPEAAASAFSQALERNVLPPGTQLNMRYNLAAVLSRLGRTREAIEQLESSLHSRQQLPSGFKRLLARLYIETKKYRQAADLLQPASSSGADENHLLLLLLAYDGLHKPGKSIRVLKQLLRLNPRHALYWQQLAARYQQMGKPKHALAVLESSWLQGLMTKPSHIRYLAQLYMQQGLAYKAGRLLDSEIKRGHLQTTAANKKLLISAWQLAREDSKAIRLLEQTLGGDGNPQAGLQLAQLYMASESWSDAARVLQQSLLSASDTQKYALLLMLGQVQYQQQHVTQSRHTFEQASAAAATRAQAQQWLHYLDYLQNRGDKKASHEE
ncbi:MAG: tetratricopeptide repeat protein [gamma proteobacterium symbiont of Bathyaustriella thionipta]|nr:tetratricopeptide repeat protein [gamma proteobacterium symbiont of Bathyaustriella thionipta]